MCLDHIQQPTPQSDSPSGSTWKDLHGKRVSKRWLYYNAFRREAAPPWSIDFKSTLEVWPMVLNMIDPVMIEITTDGKHYYTPGVEIEYEDGPSVVLRRFVVVHWLDRDGGGELECWPQIEGEKYYLEDEAGTEIGLSYTRPEAVKMRKRVGRLRMDEDELKYALCQVEPQRPGPVVGS